MNISKYFGKKDKPKKEVYEEKLEKEPRRSPKDIIKSEENKGVEHFYIKFPGENLIEASGKEPTKTNVKVDRTKVEKLLKDRSNKKYSTIHTHLHNTPGVGFPSEKDIETFLMDDNSKSMYIAQMDENTWKVKGYFCLRKTGKTKPYEIDQKINKEVFKDIEDSRFVYGLNIGRGEEMTGLDYVAKKHHLRFRMIPAKGYVFNKSIYENKFVKKDDLEKKVEASIISILFICSLFFSSYNITGYSIANLPHSILNGISVILFLLGLVGVYHYFIRRKTTNFKTSYS